MEIRVSKGTDPQYFIEHWVLGEVAKGKIPFSHNTPVPKPVGRVPGMKTAACPHVSKVGH